MYVANTAILRQANTSKTSNFQWKVSLQIMGFCFDW